MTKSSKRLFTALLSIVLIITTALPTTALAVSYNGSASYKSGKYHAALVNVQLTGNATNS